MENNEQQTKDCSASEYEAAIKEIASRGHRVTNPDHFAPISNARFTALDSALQFYSIYTKAYQTNAEHPNLLTKAEEIYQWLIKTDTK